MTYAPTVALLEETALAVGAGSFWHGPKTNQNINYNAPFPQVHLFLMPAPTEGSVVRYQVVLCFYGKDEHENGNDESIQIQDEMDQLSQRFVLALREAEDVEVAERVDRAPVLREGSAIGTGFLCSFTLAAPALC